MDFSGLLKDEEERGGGGVVKWLPCPKICHAYPKIMKLGTVVAYLKKIQKIYESCYTLYEFCWHHNLFTGNQQFSFYQEIQI